MRELLFRGKRVDNNQWIYGFYCSGYERHYISPEIFLMEREISNEYEVENEGEEPIFEDGLKLGMFNLVKPETIGQFTGLLDKNGNKIFEGDKILYDEIEGIVLFKDGSFLVRFEYLRSLHLLGELERDLEIIGNIHEN